MTIIIFILILTLLILVHELGHFIAAKKTGVLVEEFGFGYPPRIFSVKIGKTTYSLNLIPLGGFVKLYGEEYLETDSKIKNQKSKMKNKAFVYKKPWQKTLIIIAGVIGNFLLGWLLISYLFTQGIPTPTNKVIVEKVQKNTPAQLAGFQEKDVILKIIRKGKIKPQQFIIKNTNDLIFFTKKFAGEDIIITVKRNDKQLNLSVTPRKRPPQGQGPLGIIITSFEEKKYVWYQAPFYGLIEAYQITKRIVTELLKTFFQFLTLKKPAMEVAGPIGIAHLLSKIIKLGKNATLELIALLSLNLAVINLLPFPALDGGRLIFVVYEWVTKKRLNKNFERYLNLIGFTLLLILAFIISINDIIRIYK